MAMYSAYFDESGHPDDSKYIVVAGAIGDVRQWVEFEREWINALAPPGTKIFHAVDFDKRNPPFDTLTKQQADDLLSRLVGIICRRIEKSLSQAIDLDQYRIINEKYVFAECYGFPYPCAARSCFGHVESWAAKYSIPIHDIHWYLEDGAKHNGQLQWIAERDRLPDPNFRNKTELIPLQCADLLAWCHNLHLTTGGRVPARYRQALNQLFRVSNEWNLTDFRDPDRIPTITNIPLRDPLFKYQPRILKKDGRRIAAVRYWLKEKGSEPKIDRKTLVLPEKTPYDEIMKAAADYDTNAKPHQPRSRLSL